MDQGGLRTGTLTGVEDFGIPQRQRAFCVAGNNFNPIFIPLLEYFIVDYEESGFRSSDGVKVQELHRTSVLNVSPCWCVLFKGCLPENGIVPATGNVDRQKKHYDKVG